MDKDYALPKVSLTEDVDRIVKQSSRTRTCVARTCQVSWKRSHLVDYEEVVDHETANLWKGVFYF